ncbi:MAG: hypothetical protein Ta2B_19560 [Termitinemataceae bacterium]|nr:MAG: hypothetical protein Ta2B_19560 [Termitinemataceae bacterium]
MSTNLSKQKRDDLVKKIKAIHKHIATSSKDANTTALLEYLAEIEKEIKTKKYGLVFEEHREAIDEILATHVPVMSEQKELFIDNGGQMNFLIEGDNLAALQLLQKTHKGKIDVIYIDPPYNTGKKDFMYDDVFIDKDCGFRHSKWLSFMKRRLIPARTLLSASGVIFISIDDNEHTQLKSLCDEIFGEENFMANIGIQVRYADKSLNEEKPFKPLLEYVLVYAKNNKTFQPNREKEDYTTDKFIYEIEEITEGQNVIQNNHNITIFKKDEWKLIKHDAGSKKLLKETWITGSIYTTMSYGKVFQTAIEPRIAEDGLGCLYKIHGRGEDGLGYRYYTGPQKATATKGKMFSGMPLERIQEMESGAGAFRYLPIPTLFDFSADYGNIRHEGGIAFNSGKKPVKLLKQLITYHKKDNIIVLDFFAGSGSLGHAVIELNQISGSRKYILCTNNQNDICKTITYPRLKNAITENGNNSSLKYYKIDFVPISDKIYYEYADKLLLHIRELVELENGINFRDNPKVAIVLDKNELAAFFFKIEETKRFCRRLYLSHDLLLTSEQEKLLDERKIKLNLIPQYYYRNEDEA